MKRITQIRTLILTLFVLLASIPASAIERPFALSGSGVAALIVNEQGIPIGANATGSGTATHLGQWTVAGNPKYTLDDQGVFHSSGEATLTTANGDKLFIQINGILDPVAGVDQGVFYFVGGTGRFQGASGTAQFVVNINPVTQGFDLTVVGKIDY
ncbi:MAG TPA: hypothetical protein VFS76_13170 [Pyrinomonadaceae bacterium]|nr:hypothetical protein [Pyrinomonadaceae bacterium]